LKIRSEGGREGGSEGVREEYFHSSGGLQFMMAT
jgi:hypothetical protein